MFSRGKSEKDPSTADAPSVPKRLGELLIEQNLISQAQLDEAIAEQGKSGDFLGQILMGLGYVTQEDITSCVVKQCKIPHLSLLDYDISPEVVALVPKEVCLKYGLIPIDKLGRILTIAMVDPLDIDALEEVRKSCPDLRIKPILCNWHHFETVVRRAFPEAEVRGKETALTAASFGLSSAPPKPAPKAEEPSQPTATAPEAKPEAPQPPAVPPATSSPAPFTAAELGQVMQASMREAMGDLVSALASRPAETPSPQAASPLDMNALAEVLRGSIQETVTALATQLRPAEQPAVASPPVDGQAIAAVVQESVTDVLQEAMASMVVQMRANDAAPANAAPSPEILAEAIRESVTSSMQEAMASMMIQLRASTSKRDGGGLTKEALSEAMYASVREAFEIARQGQEEQGNRLAQIAEATLQAVQQTSNLMEGSAVAGQGRRDLEKDRRQRHASVAPFGGSAAPDGEDGMKEADERVRDALESEHPLESLTLDRFFPGKVNGFTYKLSEAVAAAPGGEYNPFFLYGHVGIGKTHLISGVGNAILKGNPGMRVGYVSASHFSRRLTEALQADAVDAFRDNYCHWDVLILDDIQFMGGRVEAQEEFFHIFNVLHQEQRQIIIASDKAPDRLGLLEQRLVSRFASGIVAELKAPEWETRMQILRHCAKAANVEVPEEIMSLVAMRVADDVRKMTGSLRKVMAFAELVGQDISVEMATEILSHLGAEQAA